MKPPIGYGADVSASRSARLVGDKTPAYVRSRNAKRGHSLKDVSLMLGHKSIRITEQCYAKFDTTEQRTRLHDAVRAGFKKPQPQLAVVGGKDVS